jgi:asparagine synthase (glutamine-hydrolysing)
MCGFAGFVGGEGWNDPAACSALLARMNDALAARGPDDAGYWLDARAAVALGHRRLAIVELSPAGRQPMRSASGRHLLAFNGEIYNHMELRGALESEARHAGIVWRGNSDTETLLAGFDAWGIQETVERAIGMFAFAAWDRAVGVLTLCRDRLGEKPLYYGWQGSGARRVFLFASDLAACRRHPAFEHQIDRGALALLLRHNAIPAPHAIDAGMAKLPAGCLLTLDAQRGSIKKTRYWCGAARYRQARQQPFAGSDREAIDALEAQLMRAVKRQMMADVPLGAFLSGGIDSSTVVALMQAQSSVPVRSFSIGFHEREYDEALHAKAVAAHLGTEHTELYVSAQDALAVIPRLPRLYSEPFADSSQIPTFLLSQLARRHVTVALSGDAGDELFCGYNRYRMTASLWRRLAAQPLAWRRAAARFLTAISPSGWNRLAGACAPLLPLSLQFAHFGDKVHKGAGVLDAASLDDLYLGLNSHWREPETVVIGATEPALPALRQSQLEGFGDMERMMALDLLLYLPDDILAKVDRAAMGVSLETRVPFLDHEVVEFAMRLPLSMKLRGGQTKWALRQVLYRHVPARLIERPKMGFGVPIAQWLRGPLLDWAHALLDPARLAREGYFDAAPITRRWREHLSGTRNWQHALWNVLMFQAWLEQRQRDA